MKHNRAIGFLLAALSVIGWVSLMLYMVGCSQRVVKSEADIAACYAKVDATMSPRVLTECRGYKWAECPAHDAIMVEWNTRAKECEQ